MLGFLKPYKMEMLVKDCTYYKLHYCSLCRHMVRNHNRTYAFLNSYEGTLLAMIYNELVVRDIEAAKDRCSGLPIAKVPILAPDHEAVELGALICMLAFRTKFQDNLHDETGFWTTRYNRFVLGHFDKTFRTKKERFVHFNIDLDFIETKSRQLRALEQDTSCTDIQRHLELWGDIFSHIMARPFQGKVEPSVHDALGELFTGLGRIIYLMDSMCDLHQDLKSGEFNLLVRAEKNIDPDNKEELTALFNAYRIRVDDERVRAAQTLPRIGLQECASIVKNILTHCLDNEMKKVFELMVNGKKPDERLLFNCKEF